MSLTRFESNYDSFSMKLDKLPTSVQKLSTERDCARSRLFLTIRTVKVMRATKKICTNQAADQLLSYCCSSGLKN